MPNGEPLSINYWWAATTEHIVYLLVFTVNYSRQIQQLPQKLPQKKRCCTVFGMAANVSSGCAYGVVLSKPQNGQFPALRLVSRATFAIAAASSISACTSSRCRRSAPRLAFWLEIAFPSGVFAPVLRVHGFQPRISSAWRSFACSVHRGTFAPPEKFVHVRNALKSSQQSARNPHHR